MWNISSNSCWRWNLTPLGKRASLFRGWRQSFKTVLASLRSECLLNCFYRGSGGGLVGAWFESATLFLTPWWNYCLPVLVLSRKFRLVLALKESGFSSFFLISSLSTYVTSFKCFRINLESTKQMAVMMLTWKVGIASLYEVRLLSWVSLGLGRNVFTSKSNLLQMILF